MAGASVASFGDGGRIAFGRGLPYPHAGIYSIDADGGDLQRLSPNRRNLYEDSPGYSPSGGLIAFDREVHYNESSPTPRDHEVHYNESSPTPRDHTEIVVEKLDGRGSREITSRLHVGVAAPQFYANPTCPPTASGSRSSASSRTRCCRDCLAFAPTARACISSLPMHG